MSIRQETDENTDTTNRKPQNPDFLVFSEREDCADWAEHADTEALVKAWK